MKTQEEFDAALTAWLEKAQANIDLHYAKTFPRLNPTQLSIDPRGKKYIRIIANDKYHLHTASGLGRSAFAFIQRDNGDVLKPASWKAPAKHARGNIFTNELGVGVYGANYLR